MPGVLDAQEQLFPAERLLARAQRDQLNAAVQLYRALALAAQLVLARASAAGAEGGGEADSERG